MMILAILGRVTVHLNHYSVWVKQTDCFGRAVRNAVHLEGAFSLSLVLAVLEVLFSMIQYKFKIFTKGDSPSV